MDISKTEDSHNLCKKSGLSNVDQQGGAERRKGIEWWSGWKWAWEWGIKYSRQVLTVPCEVVCFFSSKESREAQE